MGLGIDNLIGAHFNHDAGYKSRGGVKEAYIGNFKQIDHASCVLNTEETEITTFQLTSGSKIYKLEGCEDNYGGTPSFADRTADFAVAQNFTYTLPNITRQGLKNFKNLTDSGKVFVIYQTNDIGGDKDVDWRIIGFDSGLVISDLSHDLNANAGQLAFTINSKTDQEEALPFKLIVITESDNNVTGTKIRELVDTG